MPQPIQECVRARVHAMYWQPAELRNLEAKIASALADKDRLRLIAPTVRLHVLKFHVLKFHVRPRSLADALLRIGLRLEEPPSGVVLAPIKGVGWAAPGSRFSELSLVVESTFLSS